MDPVLAAAVHSFKTSGKSTLPLPGSDQNRKLCQITPEIWIKTSAIIADSRRFFSIVPGQLSTPLHHNELHDKQVRHLSLCHVWQSTYNSRKITDRQQIDVQRKILATLRYHAECIFATKNILDTVTRIAVSGVHGVVETNESTANKDAEEQMQPAMLMDDPDRIEKNIIQRILEESVEWHDEEVSIADTFFSTPTKVVAMFPGAFKVLLTFRNDSQNRCLAIDVVVSMLTSCLQAVSKLAPKLSQIIPFTHVSTLKPTSPTWAALYLAKVSLKKIMRFIANLVIEGMETTVDKLKQLHYSAIVLTQAFLRDLERQLSEWEMQGAQDTEDYQNLRSEFFTLSSELILNVRKIAAANGCLDQTASYSLAEEFRDFDTIITLCEYENVRISDSRLISYMTTYGRPFAEALFANFEGTNKMYRLLNIGQPDEYRAWLGHFLSNKPMIAWIHQLQMKQYASASSLLFENCNQPMKLLHKKHMLSIGKLALLCSSSDNKSIFEQKQKFDDAIHDTHVEAYAMNNDWKSVSVKPEELFRRLCSNGGTCGDRTSFVLALDILDRFFFTSSNSQKESVSQLYQHLWLSLIRAETATWSELLVHRVEAVGDEWALPARQMLFYQLVLFYCHKKYSGLLFSRFRESLQSALDDDSLSETVFNGNIKQLILLTFDLAIKDSANDSYTELFGMSISKAIANDVLAPTLYHRDTHTGMFVQPFCDQIQPYYEDCV